MRRSKLMLVEHDDGAGRALSDALCDAGYAVERLRSGREALLADPMRGDVWIVALTLPDAHGFDVLAHVRSTSDAPTILLASAPDPHTRVRALQLGADDLLSKPVRPDELVAHVAARLRRPTLSRSDRIEVGDLALDLAARRVTVDDAEIDLTRVEFDFLAALARRSGAAIQRLALAEQILDPDRKGAGRTLDAHASRLRKKLGRYAACIATVWGVGYRFDAAPR